MATRKVAEDTASAVNNPRRGSRQREPPPTRRSWRCTTPPAGASSGATGDGVAGNSRLDVVEASNDENEEAIRRLLNRNFVLDVGYAYVGNGYVEEDWSRPILHGPHLAVGYRSTYPAWTLMVQASGTPAMWTPTASPSAATWRPPLASATPPCSSGAVGGLVGRAGRTSPARGFAAVSGGGLDVDGVIRRHPPHPLTGSWVAWGFGSTRSRRSGIATP